MLLNPKTTKHPNFRIPRQCVWLKINGSWPLAERKSSSSSHLDDCTYRSFFSDIFDYCYTFWAWYVIVSVGITISFQTGFLIGNFGDIMMTTENCCTTLMGILNFIRLLHLRLHQQEFRHIIQKFVDDIWIAHDTHPKIETTCNKRMVKFRFMTASLACLILMYCVLPVIELTVVSGLNAVEKPFPYKMSFPFNPHKNWLRYVLIYIFTSYAGICVVTTLFAEDSILGFFITYTCGQFDILHERIDNLIEGTNSNIKSGDALQCEYVQRQKEIVQHHNKLISFTQQLEDLFNPILLVNLMVSSLLICMVGFQLVTGKNMFIGDYAKFMVYISSSILQLYILCGSGEALIQHSLTTAKHLYTCHWEGCSAINNHLKHPPANKEFRTNLQFMILCSQRPIKITAFKFSTLSLQSFTAILSTSMSYFTLLRSLLDEQE